MKSQYTYNIFSRRLGNLRKLEQFRSVIVQFNIERYGYKEHEINRLEQETIDDIRENMAGAILVFDGKRVVAYESFFEVDPQKNIFEVGFAYVEENHRRRGIWTNMSKMIEEEAMQMGARNLRRHISLDDEFLAHHLMEIEGYKGSSEDPTNWTDGPLSKRL